MIIITRLYQTRYENTDYYISADGKLYDFNNSGIVTNNFGNDILARIMAYTFCGESSFDIIYKDNDETNVSRNNIYYQLPLEFHESPEKYGYIRIPNFSRYYISKSGVVYSSIRKTVLHHRIKSLGYHLISLYDDSNIRQTLFIHRLVYYSWTGGNIYNDFHINHYDGCPWNNSLDNLEETTPLENTRHSINVIKTRDVSWGADDIHTICNLLQNGVKPVEIHESISNDREVSLNSIKTLCHHLAHGTKFWQDISKTYNFDKYLSQRYKYSNDLIHEMCQLLSNGLTATEIEKITNVPLKYISEIKKDLVRRPISQHYDLY